MEASPGIELEDDPENNVYPLAINAAVRSEPPRPSVVILPSREEAIKPGNNTT